MGEAIELGRHDYYHWSIKDGIAFGVLKAAFELDYSPEEREVLLEQDRFMRGAK